MTRQIYTCLLCERKVSAASFRVLCFVCKRKILDEKERPPEHAIGRLLKGLKRERAELAALQDAKKRAGREAAAPLDERLECVGYG